jgi:hypothetical protein
VRYHPGLIGVAGALFSRRYLVSGRGKWPIFRVQREYGRLASGSEDVNPENFGHRHSTVVFFCEISPSENHSSHSSSYEMESRRKSVVVVLSYLHSAKLLPGRQNRL